MTCPRYPADTSGVPQFSAAVTVKSGPSVAVLDSPFNPAEEGEGSMNTVEGRHTGLDTATLVTGRDSWTGTFVTPKTVVQFYLE